MSGVVVLPLARDDGASLCEFITQHSNTYILNNSCIAVNLDKHKKGDTYRYIVNDATCR